MTAAEKYPRQKCAGLVRSLPPVRAVLTSQRRCVFHRLKYPTFAMTDNTKLSIDFETRSALDLKEVGLHNYARHPTTDAWCMAYSFGVGEPRLVEPLCFPRVAPSPHDEMLEFVQRGGRVVAHNAAFELAIWNNIMVPRYGWPELKPEQTDCTMARGYAMGLPGALEEIALALGLHVLKDAEGRSLMLRMARPRSRPGQPLVWWDEPEKLQRLYEYCKQDVRVEIEVDKRVMPLSATERRVWLLDYKINNRGVQLDIPSVTAAARMADAMKVEYDRQMAAATGGAVTSCGALAALKEWLGTKGVKVDSLAKQALIDLLDKLADSTNPLAAEVRHVLTIRQEAGKASAAKFHKMAAMAGADGRLRNMYQYHGAATGRWAGRAVQTHNLVRDMPKPKAVEAILQLVREGNHDAIDAIFGPPLTAMSRCTRSLFVAPKGKLLVAGDFSNVEGRGQAWFAGEQWKLDAFVAADNGTGPGLYELAYSRMFNVPVESVLNPSEERQVGKVCELAFGYQGGVGSFHVMAKNYGVVVPDAKANEFKLAWRAAHPCITNVWYEIQRAAIAAVRNPGNSYTAGFTGRHATFKVVGSFLWCLLPSGRALCYPYPKLLENEYGPMLTYMTQPSPDDLKKFKVIADQANGPKWVRVGTYGGSLFNNIIQGMCRDILAQLMLALDDAGASIVMHTHDDEAMEVDVAKAAGARDALERMMRTSPAWAKGLPLFAKPAIMERYGK